MKKDNLTKENFFNEMQQRYPVGMKVFCDWIDEFKKANDWGELFNELNPKDENDPCGNGSCGMPCNKAPKFHDLPLAMQQGIILEFYCDYFKAQSTLNTLLAFNPSTFNAGFMMAMSRILK